MPGEVKKTFTTAGISSVDASEHLERLKREVRGGNASPRPPKREEAPRDARSEAEARWAVAVDRPIVRRPGVRGRLAYPVKRVLRRLMSWYVGPFAAEQRAFNEALLHFADELSARNDELRVALTRETDARLSAEAELGAGLYARLEQEAAVRESTTAQLEGALDERRRLLAEIEERLLRMERRRVGHGALPRSRPSPAPTRSRTTSRSSRGCAATRTRSARASGRTSRTSARPGRSSISAAAAASSWRCSAEAGIAARGVDADADMVAYARGEGLDVEQGDALAALEALEDGSLGGVFAAQLLEHLPPPALVRLLELAAAKLRPGGVFVAETINPLSPLALRNYFADLTHAQPLVPETLELLARQAGFAEVEKRFLNEPEERLTVPEDPVLARNVTRLNELLFGPLDYAIVARR